MRSGRVSCAISPTQSRSCRFLTYSGQSAALCNAGFWLASALTSSPPPEAFILPVSLTPEFHRRPRPATRCVVALHERRATLADREEVRAHNANTACGGTAVLSGILTRSTARRTRDCLPVRVYVA